MMALQLERSGHVLCSSLHHAATLSSFMRRHAAYLCLCHVFNTADEGQDASLAELLLCMQATFYALQQTYGFLSPELWKASQYTKAPLQEFTDFLAKPTIDAPKPVDNTPTY